MKNLREGMRVEVATHFTGSWTGGFEVAVLHSDRCRVRRVSDGTVLPVDLDCIEVRPAHAAWMGGAAKVPSAEHRTSAAVVGELVDMFARANNPREVEMLADQLGAAGNDRAIRPLLMRLGDCQVQEDVDVEDAVCRALVALGVMCCSGNLSFVFQPRHRLAPEVVDTLRELGPAIPMRYYLARGA